MALAHLLPSLIASANQNSGNAIAGIFALVFAVLFLGVFAWSLFWVYEDAEA